MRGWFTYTDLAALWEATDMQDTMLSASKQSAKVACGSAALYLVCVATLFAASQSLHMASEAWNCDNNNPSVTPSSPAQPDLLPFLQELTTQPTPDLQNFSYSLASGGGYEMILGGALWHRDKTDCSETDASSWPGLGFGCGAAFWNEDSSCYYAPTEWKSGNWNCGHAHPITYAGQYPIYGTVYKKCPQKSEDKSICYYVQDTRMKVETEVETEVAEIKLCTNCQQQNWTNRCLIEETLELEHDTETTVANVTPFPVRDATWDFSKTLYNIRISLLA